VKGYLLLAAAGGGATTTALTFPGSANFDEIYSLNEFWSGVLSDVHPPLHTLAWHTLIELGALLGLSGRWMPGLLLIAQVAVFWIALATLAGFLRTRFAAFAVLVFAALSPLFLAALANLGKDGHLAIALLSAMALMMMAMRNRSVALITLAAMALFYAFSIRSNGPMAVWPLCLAWAFCLVSILWHKWQERRLLTMSIGAGLFAALLAGNALLYSAAVRKNCCLGGSGYSSLVFDLMGVSFRVNKNLIPAALYVNGPESYTLEDIKRRYTPTMNMFDGLTIVTTDRRDAVVESWLSAIKAHPIELLAHRVAVASYLFGLHTGTPPYGYMSRFYTGDLTMPKVPRMEAMLASVNPLPWGPLERYLDQANQWGMFKLWPYVAIGTAAFLLFPPKRWTDPSVWLFASAIAYAAPYILIAPAAQFRYVWWSALACLLAFVFRMDDWLTQRYFTTKAVPAARAPRAATLPRRREA
jgi:hypothetical protein